VSSRVLSYKREKLSRAIQKDEHRTVLSTWNVLSGYETEWRCMMLSCASGSATSRNKNLLDLRVSLITYLSEQRIDENTLSRQSRFKLSPFQTNNYYLSDFVKIACQLCFQKAHEPKDASKPLVTMIRAVIKNYELFTALHHGVIKCKIIYRWLITQSPSSLTFNILALTFPFSLK